MKNIHFPLDDGRTQEAYLSAYHFAARAHVGQLYPGTSVSYIMHLSFVSMEVLHMLAAEPHHRADLAIQCALLHDVLEDTPTPYTAILERFGPEVAQGVRALSKDPSMPKREAMADSLARIQRCPHEVWAVKLADRSSNLQPPPAHWTREKCERYLSEAQMIYDALSPASPYLARRLSAQISRYPSLYPPS